MRIESRLLRMGLGLMLAAQLSLAQQIRAAEIEAERDAKAGHLAPDAPSKLEERLIYIKDAKVLERITAGIAGFRVKLG